MNLNFSATSAPGWAATSRSPRCRSMPNWERTGTRGGCKCQKNYFVPLIWENYRSKVKNIFKRRIHNGDIPAAFKMNEDRQIVFRGLEEK